MPGRWQRTLILLLVLNYTLFGLTFFNAQSAPLRILQQVLTFALLTGWLFSLWHKGQGLPRTPLDLPLASLLLAWVIAALAGLDPRVSLEYTWPILIVILGLYVLVDLFRHGRELWLMEALFLTGAVIVFISLLEELTWYTGTSLPFGFEQSWPAINGLTLPPVSHRLQSLMTGTNSLGNFTAVLAPLAASWAMTTRRRDIRLGAALLCAGLALVVIFSGSRGALMGLLVSAAILLLTRLREWLERPGLPSWAGFLARPHILFGLAAITGVGIAAFILFYTLTRPLYSGDANRLDLWQSSIAIFRDHPLTGVGPFQFGHAQRMYGDPQVAEFQARHTHTHNLILQTLAEGGLLTGAAAAWVVVMYVRVWWRAWLAAPPVRRHRLEGGLAALVAFAAHSMVDTFTQILSLVPILIIVAYTIYPYPSLSVQPTPRHRRVSAIALMGLLMAIEVGFVPVHRADLAHRDFQRYLSQGDPLAAMDYARAAQRLDPMLALYRMDEAYALALLAEDAPDVYLAEAITAHEESLARTPVWELGWHNLAALYARAGQFDAAIRAEQQAINLLPKSAGFHLKQGEYYEQIGDLQAAEEAYTRAVRNSPDLLTSGFWTDPVHPERRRMIAAITDALLQDPKVGLQIAIRAGLPEAGIPLVEALDIRTASFATLQQMGEWALAAGEEIAPCPECYFLAAIEKGPPSGSSYARLAELALDDPDVSEKTGFTAEQLARIALFIGDEGAPRARYVLARLADRDGLPADVVNQYLIEAVPNIFSKQEFSTVVFGRSAVFEVLPSARFPLRSESQYEPWLWLASRYEAAGDTEGLIAVYTAILAGDPYQWEIRAQLDKLTGAVGAD